VADQHGGPTSATHIAHALLTIVDRIGQGGDVTWGTYHFCGMPATTWHGFAETIVREALRMGILAHAIPIHPITTDQYPTPARRPKNSVLDCRRIMRAFGVQAPSWQEGLTAMLARIKQQE